MASTLPPGLDRLDLEQVIEELGVAEAPADWAERWSESAARLASADLWFVDTESLGSVCRWLRMSEDAEDAVLAALGDLRRDAVLLRLLWQLHDAVVRGAAATQRPSFPPLPEDRGAAGHLFYAVLCLSCVPRARELHQARGIDEQLSIETFDDIELWMRHQLTSTGRWAFSQAGWLMNHLNDRLYRLGRLQFETTRLAWPFHVYRSEGGEVVALAGDGQRFRDDGQFADADGAVDHSAWTARLRIDDQQIVGHAVSPLGAVEPEARSLETRSWQPVLGPEDPVLGVHIQASGPMREEECRASLRRASAFFRQHVPEHGFAACTCNSWLLDPQLAEHLDPDSNLVRFQSLFRLLPEPGTSDKQTFERVFGGPVEAASAPRDTALRRAVLDHVAAGGRWRSHAGIILPPEMAGAV